MRTERLEGKMHLVFPVVLLIANRILNGSHGPVYYPADEIEQSTPYWSGRPIVRFHPAFNDGLANAPQIFDQQRVGILFNAEFDGSRLMAEAWIDIKKSNAVDDQIITSLLNKKTLEVSTGLGSDRIYAPGICNGFPFEYVATKFQPDHLALLPGARGACDVKMGCGLGVKVLNEEMLVA